MNLGERLSKKESMEVQMELLRDFHDFCEKNDLKYYLMYGTLLGAVRNKGFIPWDDDIDIALPRADYEKALVLYNKENKKPHHYLVSPFDDMSRHSFAKLIDSSTIKLEEDIHYPEKNYLGVDIDIFPIDQLPGNYNRHRRIHKIKKFIFKMDLYSVTSMVFKTSKGKAVEAVCKRIGHRRWMKLAERLTNRYNQKVTGRCGIDSSLYNFEREWHKKAIFEERTKLEFEGQSFWAPLHYHELLADIYGDYMQLPPENERVSSHENQIHWRESK